MTVRKRLTKDQVIAELKSRGATRVKVAITDIDGILRGKYIHIDKLLGVLDKGFGFCDVVFGWDAADACYDNVKVTGWHTGYPDANAKIDIDTFRTIPWDNQVPFFLADFADEKGNPLYVCPRQVLKNVIDSAKKMGYDTAVGLEFEWFNFQETPQSWSEKRYHHPTPITPAMFGYSILRSGYNRPFFTAMMEELAQFDVPLEGLHTETGPGVYEAAILYSDALEAADRGVLFKTSVKEIGYRFGIMASFMAKWNVTLPGCSGHIHQSLRKGSENLFYSESDPHHMSGLFKSFLAGQMKMLPEFLAFYAPTVNSYKRLVEGFWAPTKVTWGLDNRTTALRVIAGSPAATRVETRVTGSDINPYLAVAASLASGLYGIKHNLELTTPPVQGSGYAAQAERLPRNLFEASNRLSQSKIAREIFGDDFIDHFVNTRLWEWQKYMESVSSWEMERYFEII